MSDALWVTFSIHTWGTKHCGRVLMVGYGRVKLANEVTYKRYDCRP